MKRVIVSVWVAVALLAALAGCGGKKSSTTTTTVTVAITPTAATVTTAATQQFTATVTNSTNTAVTWSVNGVAGGNQTVGFISSTGLYTAPNAVPTPATVTVTATSQANVNATTTASVTITASATSAGSMVVSPSSVTIPAGGQQTFAATVSGNPIPVNWTVNCQASAAAACGSISTGGVFTAPASPPPGANVSITATAKDNSVSPSGAVATIQFSNGTLNGRYAFTFSGQNAGVSLLAAGSVSFDGNGNITGGTEDVNSGGVSSVTITSGTYHVGIDGRGNASVATSAGAVSWQFAVVNHSHAFVIRFDAGVPSASGTLDLQDATQFASGFSGNYAFNLSGANATGKPGTLAAAGAFATPTPGIINGGVQDVNNAGTPSSGLSVSGTFTAADAAGRGTMTLSSTFATQNFAYYIVDATHLKVVETDTATQLAGDLFKQPAGPFSNASFKGGFVFALLGSTSSGAFGEGAVITLNGLGTVPSGTMDVNANGNPQNGLAVSGTYTVADVTTGRTTVSLSAGGSTLQYAAYPQINGALSMVEIDTSNTVAGRALAQASTTFASGSVQGNYALNLSGTDFVINPGEEDVVGQMLPNGGSAASGTMDISDAGVIGRSAALSTVAPGYSVGANGRGTMPLGTNSATFTAAGFNIYVADSSNVLFLESDPSRVLVGVMQKQF